MIAFSVLLFSVMLAPPAHATTGAPQALQAEIVRLYSEGRCDKVRRISARTDLRTLRPNVMAIVAFCEPPGRDPEELFARAESLNPTGDLILVLHAKYRWKRDPKSAEPLWERVLVVARNKYFRNLAREYLAGVVNSEELNSPLDLSPSTGFATIAFRGSHHTNAQPVDYVFQPKVASNAISPRGEMTYRRWYRFGSLAANANVFYERFFAAPQYNSWDSNFDLPVAIHIVTDKDLIIRPFSGYSTQGGRPLRLTYGMGVAGAVFHDIYKQSVQGFVYADRIFAPEIQPQQGAHYRFEYEWDLYPALWFFSTNFSVEHVSATSTDHLFDINGHFEMSHTDVGLDLRAERELSKVTVGIHPRVVYRVDSGDSQYLSRLTAQDVSKRRQDWDVSLQANVAMPVLPSIQLYAWYEWHHVFSNMGAEDYVDRNFNDQSVGAGIRAFLSTY